MGQQLSSDRKSPGLILSVGSSNKPGMWEPNRVMYGGMFTALAVTQLQEKPGEAGRANPPAEILTITATSTVPTET